MTKAKKPAANLAATKKEAATKKTSPKKNYMVGDEDEDEDELVEKEVDEDDELDADLNDADIVIPKSFDPFDDDDDDDDDF